MVGSWVIDDWMAMSASIMDVMIVFQLEHYIEVRF